MSCSPSKAETEVQPSDWQNFSGKSVPLTLKYPPGWNASINAQNGRIDLTDNQGTGMSLLNFFLANQTVESLQPDVLFETFIKMFAPSETWTKPQTIGANSFHADYTNEQVAGSAAMILQNTPQGVSGLVCVTRTPRSKQESNINTMVRIMNSLRYKTPDKVSSSTGVRDSNNGSFVVRDSNEDFDEDDDDDEVAQSGNANASPSSDSFTENEGRQTGWQAPGGNPNGFAGYTKFTDPSEHSFTVDVPAGWKVDGGLTRYGALDVRPWVKAVSPDNLVFAFIGDGRITPCTMPTGTLSALGFRVGSNYNGSIIRPYIPARQFVEKYARMTLNSFLSDLQVVQSNNHPDVARAVNGTVGATRSEAASIKMTGMYGQIPAVAYYLAVTKATVASGTGMWWVTKVAGSVGPSAREAECLGVILHMLQTFEIDPAWSSNSLRNTAAVSQHYRRVSQQVSQSISDRYWSQQGHNDRMNQAYWNRQASQDRAANNFSNYIRGVENVQNPNTGTKYQVQYGPQEHYIDSGGNYIVGGDHGAPGPDWQQLLRVP